MAYPSEGDTYNADALARVVFGRLYFYNRCPLGRPYALVRRLGCVRRNVKLSSVWPHACSMGSRSSRFAIKEWRRCTKNGPTEADRCRWAR
jgi:hypothetical protein